MRKYFKYLGNVSAGKIIEYTNILFSKIYSAWQKLRFSIPTNHQTYRQVSNIRRTLVGNKIVDHSDVVGASPVGTAPTTSSFST